MYRYNPAHIRAYARVGTLEDETIATLKEIGITFTECPLVAEGSDVVGLARLAEGCTSGIVCLTCQGLCLG